ncbi:flavin-binding monooxygenase [Penicillium soppii]|uniref:flavin-binding monooxygenase n=1 Tax=Penicillium soppii TaxID=69789 RepID=UPI002547BF72|nr:flavin-binding monooxygenase [Penicillium soppii]KAJ5865297.1 flavin-binding monooxygenase [Penicillium soppii]
MKNEIPIETQFDVIIVGAGIAGINAAYRLQTEHPWHSYAILEARSALRGTWDLFRYPGVRSDSDLFTFGFSWYPWNQDHPIADGNSIRQYMSDAASQHTIDQRILFHHRLTSAHWSTADYAWTLKVDCEGTNTLYSTRFIILCTGYYDYDVPLEGVIPRLASFKGPVIHPQFWPDELDYEGKRVIIVGSGATAVTLLPKMAEKAALVTMLQRSPTYILPMKNKNKRTVLDGLLPETAAHQLNRVKWIATSRLFVLVSQKAPSLVRWLLRQSVTPRLPKNIPYDPHFEPKYNPWEQRLCISPDGDFFQSLHTGRADVKTGTIQDVVDDGIVLTSGEKLHADVIVTATGLSLKVAGGISLYVDGEECRIPEKYLWNGVMLQDVPNASYIMGYANASWTLGADAKARFTCRLLLYLKKRKLSMAVPRLQDTSKMKARRLFNLTSTYVVTAEDKLPKAARQKPWKPHESYLSELMFAKYGCIDDCLELA